MLELQTPTSRVAALTEYGWYVHGKKATSNEAYVAMAFEHEGFDFLFQVWYRGGRAVLGGQVLDFLVFAPFPIPVQVFGDYWHKGQLAGNDRYLLAQIQQMVGRPPVVIWGSESDTYEKALATVRRKVV